MLFFQDSKPSRQVLRNTKARAKSGLRATTFRVVEAAYLRLSDAPEHQSTNIESTATEVDSIDLRDRFAEAEIAGDVNWLESEELNDVHFDEKVSAFLDLEVANTADRNWLLPS